MTDWSVVDLYSGAGGASAGFAAHPRFSVVAAADAQVGKPSSGFGRLGCNETFTANLGIHPLDIDLAEITGEALRTRLGLGYSPDVLIACPPCTGFSRTYATNHLRDDPRNSLVGGVGGFVEALRPKVIVMENAREMLMGRFAKHFDGLREDLESQGYDIQFATYFLNRFGLPQMRERAIVVAAKRPLRAHDLADLWRGHVVTAKATHVRRAIWELPPIEAGEVHCNDSMHVAPAFGSPTSRDRLKEIPADGGSWKHLLLSERTKRLMTGTMLRLASKGKFGSFPDVYGRLAWDRPAPTIKRECGHVGNGRYAHPEQHRLCSVRELAILQGFPSNYQFAGSLSNKYRHLGDAVPPLIARQLASVTEWILTGSRPDLGSVILDGTHLSTSDINRS